MEQHQDEMLELHEQEEAAAAEAAAAAQRAAHAAAMEAANLDGELWTATLCLVTFASLAPPLHLIAVSHSIMCCTSDLNSLNAHLRTYLASPCVHPQVLRRC